MKTLDELAREWCDCRAEEIRLRTTIPECQHECGGDSKFGEWVTREDGFAQRKVEEANERFCRKRFLIESRGINGTKFDQDTSEWCPGCIAADAIFKKLRKLRCHRAGLTGAMMRLAKKSATRR